MTAVAMMQLQALCSMGDFALSASQKSEPEYRMQVATALSLLASSPGRGSEGGGPEGGSRPDEEAEAPAVGGYAWFPAAPAQFAVQSAA